MVAPIFSGAGTAVKVLEAALHGRKMLATPFAVRGLDVDQRNLFGISIVSNAEQTLAAIDDFATQDENVRRSSQLRWAHAAQEELSFDAFIRAVRDLMQG